MDVSSSKKIAMAKSLPHSGVFSRISVSAIHGVGVRAIRPIKKGAYVFPGDDEKMRWIDKLKLKRVPIEIRKLYKDFCVEDGKRLGCPQNFNRMTIAWYLNHSNTPNLAADRSYRFYALRNIKKGEELTADYGTYNTKSRRRRARRKQ